MVRTGRAFWIGVLVGAVVMAAILTAVFAARRGDTAAAAAFLRENGKVAGVVQTASGLQYKILAPGAGPKPTDADVARITYRGTLTDGTVFDESREPTPLPVAGVVPGFAEALKLMSKGATYRLWIKPELGYGDRAAGPIPAGSVLVFDVTLIDFLPESVVREAQRESGSPTP